MCKRIKIYFGSAYRIVRFLHISNFLFKDINKEKEIELSFDACTLYHTLCLQFTCANSNHTQKITSLQRVKNELCMYLFIAYVFAIHLQ